MKLSASLFRERSDAELLRELEEEERALARLRRDRLMGELKNHRSIRTSRHRIALMKTVMRERTRNGVHPSPRRT